VTTINGIYFHDDSYTLKEIIDKLKESDENNRKKR
jgi:hypothetical protein